VQRETPESAPNDQVSVDGLGCFPAGFMVQTDAPSQPSPDQPPPRAVVHGGPGLLVLRVTPLSWLAGQPTPVTCSMEVIGGADVIRGAEAAGCRGRERGRGVLCWETFGEVCGPALAAV